MVEEFKKFLMRGPVLDLAVGVIIGAAFGAIVNSLVNDILMPPLGLVLGSVDFKDLFVVLKAGEVAGPYATLAAAKEAGAVTLNYGLFANSFVSFLIIGFSIFMVIKAVNKVQPPTLAPPPPPTKECDFCRSKINPAATRCPQCTSQLSVA